MTRSWPIDNYAYTPTHATEQSKEEDIKTNLYDLCRVAPSVAKEFGIKLNRRNLRDEMDHLYHFFENNIKGCATVKDVAALCIKLCDSYKFPIPDNTDETTVKHLVHEFEKVFHVHTFREASFRYLVLQFLYIHKPIKMDLYNNESTRYLMKQFYSEKSSILNPKTVRSFSYPSKDFFISKLLNLDYSDGDSIYDFIIKSGLDTTRTQWNPYVINYLHSNINLSEEEIIDLFPEAFKPDKNSPDKENLLPSFKNFIKSLSVKKIKPNLLRHFLSSFHLEELIPTLDDHNFNSVSNYITERITNINLINCLYNIYTESNFPSELHDKTPKEMKEISERHLTSHFYLLANYPLVSYRLDLLRLLCHGPNDYPLQTTDDGVIVIDYSNKQAASSDYSLSISRENQVNPTIRLDYLHNILLFQTLFYFPLLTKLFHTLLFLRGDAEKDYDLSGLINSNDNFILEEDICSLFQIITSSTEKPRTASKAKSKSDVKYSTIPVESFPAVDSSYHPDLYQNIQYCIYQLYYEQVVKLKDQTFMEVGYSFGNDINRFSDSIIDALGLNITKEYRYSPDGIEAPLYVNFCEDNKGERK